MTNFHNILKWILVGVLLSYRIASADAQININVIGNWNYSLPPNSVVEAGLDLSGTYTSNTNAVTIDVLQSTFFANRFLNYSWRVDVRKSDVDWNPGLILYTRRTGTGSPFWSVLPGAITGGTNYQQLTNTNQIFFSGNRSRLNIPIQYQLSGVSVLLEAKTYVTTVIYTVTEL